MIDIEDIEWIEINLPFYTPLEKIHYPEYPDIKEDMEKDLGKKVNIESLFSIEVLKIYNKIDEFKDNRDIEEIDYSGDVSDLKKYLCNIFEENIVDLFLEFRKYKYLENEWIINNPKIIEWQKEYHKVMEYKKSLTFCGRGLNTPGTLIEIEIDEENTIFLIGNINTHGETPDDIEEFDGKTIVKRYAKVINL